MRSLLVACSLLAAGALAGASVAAPHDRNLAFVMEALGLDAAPEGTTILWEGAGAREVPIAEALRLAAARPGAVDLSALVASTGPPATQPFGVGDVWIFEIGWGDCPLPTAFSSPVPDAALHPQLATHSGGIGTMSTFDAYFGYLIDWTTKGETGGAYGGLGSTLVGQADFFCFTVFGLMLYFPMVDGAAYTHD